MHHALEIGRFDLAPPGAIWYHERINYWTAVLVLISLPPELSGIPGKRRTPAVVLF